jgi:hypothetical protein
VESLLQENQKLQSQHYSMEAQELIARVEELEDLTVDLKTKSSAQTLINLKDVIAA